MGATPTADERRHPRLEGNLPAGFRVLGLGTSLSGSILNLSAGGAALLTPVPIPVNSIVEELKFSLPSVAEQGRAEVAVSAIVRWVARRELEGGGRQNVAGLEFLDLEGERLLRLRSYLYHHLLDAPPETAN